MVMVMFVVVMVVAISVMEGHCSDDGDEHTRPMMATVSSIGKLSKMSSRSNGITFT